MLRAALLTLFILIVLPATASAACRTDLAAYVWYDSPVLQVREDRTGFVSCLRPTGKEFVYRDPEGQLAFDDVWEDRYFSLQPAAEPERRDREFSEPGMSYDTWTGKPATGGWRLRTGRDGIVLHREDGSTRVIDPTPVTGRVDFVRQGRRVYWRSASGARTALLEVPAEPAPPKAKPLRARRTGKCVPRKRANLVVRHEGLVVTRKGRSVDACFGGRVTPIGDARAFKHLVSDFLAYRRPGFAGLLGAYSRRKREVPSAGGPIAADIDLVAAVDRNGILRALTLDGRRPTILARGGATDVAVDDHDVFWTDPQGRARVKTVR